MPLPGASLLFSRHLEDVWIPGSHPITWVLSFDKLPHVGFFANKKHTPFFSFFFFFRKKSTETTPLVKNLYGQQKRFGQVEKIWVADASAIGGPLWAATNVTFWSWRCPPCPLIKPPVVSVGFVGLSCLFSWSYCTDLWRLEVLDAWYRRSCEVSKKCFADFKECPGAQSLKLLFNEHRRNDMNTPSIN